jgi:hypothetical protein
MQTGDEYIPIDPELTYRLSFFAKTSNENSRFYSFIRFYDMDNNTIAAYNHMYVSGTTTTLAQELKNGDTEIVLTDSTNWKVSDTSNNRKRIIFWNYESAGGYKYGTETYSRNLSPAPT